MSDPDFLHALRVYWEDTDAGGVVFYANYLKYFERARTEWLRSKGFGQHRLRAETGAIFVVTDTAVSYREPARLDDRHDLTVHVVETGGASLTFRQEARRAGAVLAVGTIRIGCVDAGTFKPRRIPNELLSLLR
jgi:acyl-CoA thioester hydrolase